VSKTHLELPLDLEGKNLVMCVLYLVEVLPSGHLAIHQARVVLPNQQALDAIDKACTILVGQQYPTPARVINNSC
jgi:hypothetical protein